MLAIVILSWWYLVDMHMMAMMIMGQWSSADWIALFVLAEKVLPYHWPVSTIAGLFLMCGAVYLAYRAGV